VRRPLSPVRPSPSSALEGPEPGHAWADDLSPAGGPARLIAAPGSRKRENSARV